jgi:monofunctional chorismate mutase
MSAAAAAAETSCEMREHGATTPPTHSTTPPSQVTRRALTSGAPIEAHAGGLFTHQEIRQEEHRLREHLVNCLVDRSRYALNDIVYKPAQTIRPTATSEGLDLPLGMENNASFLDYFLHETEKLHSMMRRYAAPEHQPFTRKLPEPVFPLPNRPEVLRSNTISINGRIKSVYLARVLPAVCRTDIPNDGEYGSTVEADIDSLQKISAYVHHAKFSAEILFANNTDKLAVLIRAGDAESILASILGNGDAVKQELNMVRSKAISYSGSDVRGDDRTRRDMTEKIVRIFSDYVLPLKRQVQVAYLLERMDGLKVAYLGPVGTYSQQAALAYFRSTSDESDQERWSACRAVSEVLNAVVANEATYAVVPIENSQTGIASSTRDLLVQGALNVIGEIYIPVKHHLVTACSSLDKVTKIYSHAQGFDQCERWLTANCPNIQRVAVNSTAKGAMVAAMEKESSAAICSGFASTTNGLPILHANIMDSASNATRFLILGRGRSPRTGADNTLLNICIGHEPGALAKCLTLFAKHGINLSAIESFPDRESPRRCYVWTEVKDWPPPSPVPDLGARHLCTIGNSHQQSFLSPGQALRGRLAQVEGHTDDAPLRAAMSELSCCANSTLVLGSFPRDSARDSNLRTRTMGASGSESPSGAEDAGVDDLKIKRPRNFL